MIAQEILAGATSSSGYDIYPADVPAGGVPVVFASAHSGRDYSAAFLALSRLDPVALRRSEDCFIDDLFAAAPGCGARLITARFPRAWCDPNREKWELDPAMFEDALPPWVNSTSPRVAAGLGTIARVVSSGEAIYARKLRFAEAVARIEACWQPYHDALAALTEGVRAAHGACLLIDCHSMPGHACQDRRPVPDIVLGDAYGASCAPLITQDIELFFVKRGYVVRRNDPYAGGFVTRHYGRPSAGLHAVQIEIARGLYMDEVSLARTAGFARLEADLAALARFLAERAGRLMGG